MNKKKCLFSYLLGSLFLFIFQLIYHRYSHGVVSKEMQFVWLLPLVTLISLSFFSLFIPVWARRLSLNLIHSGLAILIVKAILSGILEIAGSDSPYLFLYTDIGAVMLIIGVLLLVAPTRKKVRDA